MSLKTLLIVTGVSSPPKSSNPSAKISPLTRFRSHSLSEISLSYNGGKDCLVLLILLLASLSTHPAPLPPLLSSVYIVSRHPFPQVDDFVISSSRRYHLSLSRHTNSSMKAAFADYLKERDNVKCIFVGTRRTDPHGENLSFFDLTDRGWPSFMRCHPMIDWHYAEIWTVSAVRRRVG